MMKNKSLNLIDDYLSGQLSDDQRDLFLNKLRMDKQFALEFKEYIGIISFLSDKESMGLMMQLKAIINKQTRSSPSETSIKSLVIQSLSYAALLVILISLTFFINQAVLKNLPNIDRFYVIEFSDSSTHLEDSTYHEFSKAISEKTVDSIIYIQNNSISNNGSIQLDTFNNKPGPAVTSENAYLVNNIYSELLSSNFRSRILNIIEPIDSSIYLSYDTISFIWEANQDTGLFMEILNNNGLILIELSLDSLNSYKLINQYSAGVYIVKFRTESELLDIRIFFVY